MEKGADYEQFRQALRTVTLALSRMVAADGEGASTLFTVKITGADTKENAKKLAKSVVGSSLVKAMVFGRDANFGRLLCALGYAGVDFDPDRVNLWLESEKGSLLVYSQGMPQPFDEGRAKDLLTAPEVCARADMGMGQAQATAWGCDLTYDYVKINADYRS